MRFFLHAATGLILLFATSLPAASAKPTAAEGHQLANNGDLKAAVAAFDAAHRANPGDLEVLVALIRTHGQLENHAEAVQLAEAATRLAPEQALPWLTLADALSGSVNEVGMVGKFKLARRIRDAYEKAAELEPDNLRARFSVAMFHAIAPGVAGGSKKKAEAEILAIEQRDAALGFLARSQVAAAGKDQAQVEALLRKAAAQDDEHALALANWLAQRQRFEEALAELHRLTRQHPDQAAPFYQVGRLAALGKASPDAGIEALRTYLDLSIDWAEGDPAYCWARYRLGQILAATGQTGQARAEYQQALALNPDFDEVRTALDALADGA